MKKGLSLSVFLISLFVFIASSISFADEVIDVSCSAQIADAFRKEVVEEFIKESGIQVNTHVVSSRSAMDRLQNGFSDIAATTVALPRSLREKGFVEIAICRDPLAIVTLAGNPVDKLTQVEVNKIFNGYITNWKQVGGEDKTIIVVTPGSDTGAYENFNDLVMKYREPKFDIMTYRSIDIMNVVKYIPDTVSFIGYGNAVKRDFLKTVKIDGYAPSDAKYPWHQTFYLITRGHPKGVNKDLINYVLSEKGVAVMKSKGMIPLVQ